MRLETTVLFALTAFAATATTGALAEGNTAAPVVEAAGPAAEAPETGPPVEAQPVASPVAEALDAPEPPAAPAPSVEIHPTSAEPEVEVVDVPRGILDGCPACGRG